MSGIGSARRRGWLRRHSLSSTLIAIWASFTLASLLLGRAKYAAEAEPISFWVWWWYEYSMSLVADCFGALLLVVVTKYTREQDSAESK
jgi:hypothetical protein